MTLNVEHMAHPSADLTSSLHWWCVNMSRATNPKTAKSWPCTGHCRGRDHCEDIAWWESQRLGLSGLVWWGSRIGSRKVSMCFHLSPDVQGVRCTETMLRQIPNSIIGNSPCTTCLSIILWKNWRTDSFSPNRPLQHSYQFQRICTTWLRMINWSSSIRVSQTSMVIHFTWNAGVGKPVSLGNRTPKHIDDHIGCFGCWVLSRHLFHSDCSFDDSSDHCHCW